MAKKFGSSPQSDALQESREHRSDTLCRSRNTTSAWPLTVPWSRWRIKRELRRSWLVKSARLQTTHRCTSTGRTPHLKTRCLSNWFVKKTLKLNVYVIDKGLQIKRNSGLDLFLSFFSGTHTLVDTLVVTDKWLFVLSFTVTHEQHVAVEIKHPSKYFDHTSKRRPDMLELSITWCVVFFPRQVYECKMWNVFYTWASCHKSIPRLICHIISQAECWRCFENPFIS